MGYLPTLPLDLHYDFVYTQLALTLAHRDYADVPLNIAKPNSLKVLCLLVHFFSQTCGPNDPRSQYEWSVPLPSKSRCGSDKLCFRDRLVNLFAQQNS